MTEKLATIEGLLFLSGDEGMTIDQLVVATQYEQEEIEKCLDLLIEEYLKDTHGIEIVGYGQIYKFISKEKIHEVASVYYSSTHMPTLSQAALETLAIIAYKQPITRVEIEEIRGVNCDMMVRKLLARNLIKECGRTDAPGRPFLYSVTEEFMDAFKLESLNELPELPKVEELAEDDLFSHDRD